MEELYKQLGFRSNPFEKSSAEEELNYLEAVYINPRYYNTLIEDIKGGNTRIVFGERGTGKSALMYKLSNDLQKYGQLNVLINRYDDVLLKNNASSILIKIIESCINSLSIELLKNHRLLKKLDKIEKEKLTLFIVVFFKSMSKTEFNKVYNKTTNYKTKNFIKKIYNWFLNKPINTLISSSVEILSDTVSRSLGLNTNINTVEYKKYLPEAELEISSVSKINKQKYTYLELKMILDELVHIINKCGFKNVAVLFDKIDEFRLINGDVGQIVTFVKDILSDTDLLYSKGISIVFFLWSRVRKELNENKIRYDKFRPKDISWEISDLKEILEKRITYFSDGKVQINDLIKSPDDYNLILSVANRSPRDLIILLSYIYDENSMLKSNNNFFLHESIKKGIDKFIYSYDFYSIYPKQKGARIDIYSLINEIEKIGTSEFTVDNLSKVLKSNKNTAKSHIQIMQNYGIVKRIDNLGDSRVNRYKVIDTIINQRLLKLNKAV